MIQDPELREIYQASSEEHLQKIEAGLLDLEQNPESEDSLEKLLRELHSLKGDSRIVEVESVENIAHSLENVLGSLQKHELNLATTGSEFLYAALDAMKSLVTESITGESRNVDVDYILNRLEELINDNNQKSQSDESREIPVIDTQPVYIDDDELRDIYKISCEEHLQKIESEILYLENHPHDSDSSKMDEVLREVHSIKGDSRIIGVQSVEILSHAMEDVLKSIQNEETQFTPELGDRLYQTLDGIGKIVQETVTGIASGVDANKILHTLLLGNDENLENVSDYPIEIVVSAELEEEESLEIEDKTNSSSIARASELDDNRLNKEEKTAIVHEGKKKESSPTMVNPNQSTLQKHRNTNKEKIGEPYKIDTLRVQTQLLDALMTQTGELTVTKVRIAHFAAQVQEIASLWENWQNIFTQQSFSGENLQETSDFEEKFGELIEQLKITSTDNSTRLDLIAEELEEKIRTMRLLPLSNVFQFFPRLVRDLSKQEGKEVELIIEGGETVADKKILEEIKDPLMHLIRNSLDHGIETPAEREKNNKPPKGKIWLRGYQSATNIFIEVQDDGQGLDIDKIKETAIRRDLYRPEELEIMTDNQIQSLIFEPSFSTRKFITEVSGRGVGLDVVRTNLERLKGSIEIDSIPGEGCTFRMLIGTTLATANVLLVKSQNITHAIPIEFVKTTLLISKEQIFTIEGRETITLEDQAISVATLSDLLELNTVSFEKKKKNEDESQPKVSCVLIKINEDIFGLFVDEVIDTQDVVIKPQSQLLKRVRNVTGATILGTGEVCMILNPQDLLKSIQKRLVALSSASQDVKIKINKTQSSILLVEDSIATRTQEKRILENAGFDVTTAVDGLDGWNKIQTEDFDVIVSDVQMPNLDGLGLTERIRQEGVYNELPIILVTSLASDEDKRKGAEVGANAYIIKGKFNQEVLIETINRLV